MHMHLHMPNYIVHDLENSTLQCDRHVRRTFLCRSDSGYYGDLSGLGFVLPRSTTLGLIGLDEGHRGHTTPAIRGQVQNITGTPTSMYMKMCAPRSNSSPAPRARIPRPYHQTSLPFLHPSMTPARCLSLARYKRTQGQQRSQAHLFRRFQKASQPIAIQSPIDPK